MVRVYCPPPLVGQQLEITGPEAHYLANVRRMGPGDEVAVFDGHGNLVRGRVLSVSRNRVMIVRESSEREQVSSELELTIATAVPKGDRFDWLIEKATELGVARLIPLRTARSVVDPRAGKLERLRRHVIEACKQSGRNRLMELGEPQEWDELVTQPLPGARLIGAIGGQSLRSFPPQTLGTIAIGPEGGFTESELEAGLASGWQLVRLAGQTLRIETAGLAAAATFLNYFGSEED